MSYGTEKVFKTKAALRRAVEAEGAGSVRVFGTSLYGDEKASTVEDLAGSSAVIVGPNVYQERTWYANVKRGKDGTAKIV